MTANEQAVSPHVVADGGATSTAHTEARPSVRPKLASILRRVGQGRHLQGIGSGGPPIYQAAAALPHRDRGRATEGLRAQLTIMAAAAGVTPDWSTLDVTGPTERTGTQQGARFEWRGRVAMCGSSHLVALPDPDAFLQPPAANGDTVPFRVDSSWKEPLRAEQPGSAQPPRRRSPSETATRAAA